jgi:hypothetical protein
VAFRVVQHGPLAGEDPRFGSAGAGSDGAVPRDAGHDGADRDDWTRLHLAGVVRVAGGRVTGGRIIRDRLGLLRRLAAVVGQTRP